MTISSDATFPSSSSLVTTARLRRGKSIEARDLSFWKLIRVPGSGSGTSTATTSSPGSIRRFQMPSDVKKPATGTFLLPSGPAISTCASSAMRTGGVSAECAATQRVPPGTTWQSSPSFFRQNPSAFRQKYVWL